MQTFNQAIPVIVILQKMLGPLMVLIGLQMIGWLRVPVSIGFRLRHWLLQRWKTQWPHRPDPVGDDLRMRLLSDPVSPLFRRGRAAGPDLPVGNPVPGHFRSGYDGAGDGRGDLDAHGGSKRHIACDNFSSRLSVTRVRER